MRKRPSSGDRAQAYTLEGVISAIIVLTAFLYGIQVVDFGPSTSDTSDERASLSTQAADMLDMAAENGTLSRAVRCYDIGGKYAFSGERVYDNSTHFERMLNQTFDRQGRNYYIEFSYRTPNGSEESVPASEAGSAGSGVAAPSSSAVVVTRTVTLFDDDHTRTFDRGNDRHCGNRGDEVSDVGAFYVDDIAPNSELYNVVEVRLVVW